MSGASFSHGLTGAIALGLLVLVLVLASVAGLLARRRSRSSAAMLGARDARFAAAQQVRAQAAADRCPPPLRGLVQAVVQRYQPQAQQQGLSLAFDCTHADVQVDTQRLGEVMHLLLANALRYTREGGVRLWAQLDPANESGTAGLCIEVSDTGAGISAASQALLFDAFVRAGCKQANTPGLRPEGLRRCKDLVESMQGHIEVRSVVGKGTVVTVRVPINRTGCALANSNAPSTSSGALAPMAFKLSADDQAALQRMFCEISAQDLVGLEQAVSVGDLRQAYYRIHRLHGAALTVGAKTLSRQLGDFEQWLQEARAIPTDASARIQRLRKALEAYQCQGQGSSTGVITPASP